jgi:hypothetical protein
MADEVSVRFKAVKKSGDDVLDASTDWALAADTVWWAPLPAGALGKAGDDAGLIADYTQLCKDVNAELRGGSRTLGMTAAALWKVSNAYKNAEDRARDKVLSIRGFDPDGVPKDYW